MSITRDSPDWGLPRSSSASCTVPRSTVTNRGVLELTAGNPLGCILKPLKVTDVTEIGIKKWLRIVIFIVRNIHLELTARLALLIGLESPQLVVGTRVTLEFNRSASGRATVIGQALVQRGFWASDAVIRS